MLNHLLQLMLFALLLLTAPLQARQTIIIKNFSNQNESTSLFRFKAKTNETNKFYIQSGLHGNEKGAIEFTNWLIKRLENSQGMLSRLLVDSTIDILPIANPDGFKELNRYNNEGVNLNRNFDVLFGLTKENPGQNKFSERETQNIRKLFNENQYTGAVDIHGYINWIVGPSDPIMLGESTKYSADQIEKYKKWHSSLLSITQNLSGYEFKTAGGLGDGGSFEDWAFWSTNTFAFCLEVLDFKSKENRSINKNMMYLSYEKAIYDSFLAALKIKNSHQALASNP